MLEGQLHVESVTAKPSVLKEKRMSEGPKEQAEFCKTNSTTRK